MTILIAGGGIGGLITAMMLHERGHSVRVFESVPEIRELGLGINLLPHAFQQFG
jgi:2-polyprenyl-6-methoxyphenol hydroxylase-like FAD-dependent oxidoreductase